MNFTFLIQRIFAFFLFLTSWFFFQRKKKLFLFALKLPVKHQHPKATSISPTMMVPSPPPHIPVSAHQRLFWQQWCCSCPGRWTCHHLTHPNAPRHLALGKLQPGIPCAKPLNKFDEARNYCGTLTREPEPPVWHFVRILRFERRLVCQPDGLAFSRCAYRDDWDKNWGTRAGYGSRWLGPQWPQYPPFWPPTPPSANFPSWWVHCCALGPIQSTWTF